MAMTAFISAAVSGIYYSRGCRGINLGGLGLGGHGRGLVVLGHELDQRLLGGVALAGAELVDAGVAAVAGEELRGAGLEEELGGVLVAAIYWNRAIYLGKEVLFRVEQDFEKGLASIRKFI